METVQFHKWIQWKMFILLPSMYFIIHAYDVTLINFTAYNHVFYSSFCPINGIHSKKE